MTQRRPAHKSVHSPCPNHETTWYGCDLASAQRFGHCKAIVGKQEPEPCSRWAFDDAGYCGQHYVSLKDAETRKARQAADQLQLNMRIERYLMWREGHPSVWDGKLAPGLGVKPSSALLENAPPSRLPGKGPRMYTADEL